MNENQILSQLTDQLKLYSYGARDMLQSPQAQAMYKNMVLTNNPSLPLNQLGKNILRGLPIAGLAYNIYSGLNSPVQAGDLPYDYRYSTATPFEQQRMSNIKYFGR